MDSNEKSRLKVYKNVGKDADVRILIFGETDKIPFFFFNKNVFGSRSVAEDAKKSQYS
jgi:hypothetical protein